MAMTTRSVLSGIAVFLFATPALAAADVHVQIQAPAAEYVYDTTLYDIVISNIGNKRADNVSLTIDLPETNTSPNVYVMGQTSGIDPRCAWNGTQLHCNLGNIARNGSTTVSFGIALPQADEELAVSASASSSSAENTLANNSDTDVAPLLNHAIEVLPGDFGHNRHCTGQGLTSFYECELFPSSISEHDIEFLADGELAIVDQPDFTGSWSQPTATSLLITYEDIDGNVVAEFECHGVSESCFEGITTFPDSEYMSVYEVCI
jgi:hypothetical protein